MLAEMGMAVALLLIGFILLVKGADYFVEGSSNVAKRLKVPSIIIGLTIVAMGTSLPETAVSATASLMGKNTLAISNVTGSNIFNLMVVIGVCSLMAPIVVQRETVRRDLPISILCAILLLGMAVVDWAAGNEIMQIGRIDGVLLLVLFILYIAFLVRSAMKARREESSADNEEVGQDLLSVPFCIFYIVGGAAAIILGGDLVVDNASIIATKLGMSETLVGLTIVSIGTSLPELVTSIVAARKNEVDMALGNAIGSCIFNALMILGIAGTISPITFITENLIDLGVLVGFSLVMWLFAATKNRISRIEGVLMLLCYAGYTAYIIIR